MVRRLLASLIALVAFSIFTAAPAGAAVDASGNAGAVRFVKRMTPAFDRYVINPSPQTAAWLNQKLWRTEVFTPFFDDKLAMYGNGWFYSDIYAIYNGSDVAAQHPEWILKDANGRKLFIPWGCGGGTCPQYAADITNPDYRAWWIGNVVRNMAKGYKGVWVDDVNLELRVGDNLGRDAAPFSPALGRTMAAADWRRAMAEFTEQLRAAIPQAEILHNSIWYAAQGAGRDADPFVQRQIAAADYINVERGFNDDGLTGGTGEWSLRALQGFIDRVHGKGKGVIIDAFDASPAGMEYSLANYLLISTGRDGVGQIDMTPDNWWTGWDTDLGAALTDRYDYLGVQRRDFAGGMALVGEPGAPARRITLPSAMTTVDGRTVTEVTVGGGQGVVLRGVGQAGTPTTAQPKPTPTPAPTTAPTQPGTGTGGSTCTKTRVTYPTLRWDAKRGRFVRAKGSSVVCIPSSLAGRAHRAALKQARESARRSSVRQAKAARREAVRAEAARAAAGR